MITFYVAAPWAEREYAKTVRNQLVDHGHNVNSRWLDFVKDAGPGGLELAVESLRQEAMNDLQDIVNADAFLLLNMQKRGEETSGKAVETGFAIANLKPIILVGEPTNVFHYLRIPTFGTIDEVLEWLKVDGVVYMDWVLSRQMAFSQRLAGYFDELAQPVEINYPSE